METTPKILIGAPTAAPYSYCLEEYINAVKSLTYKNCKLVLVDNSEKEAYDKEIEKHGVKAIKYPKYIEDSRERLAASRNILRDIVLNENYDYFLSLEQDVIPPKDIIEKLLSHKKDVITGIYYKPMIIHLSHKGKVIKSVKKIMPLLCGFVPGIEGTIRFYTLDEVQEPGMFKVRSAGLGCMLIHRKVLEKIKFRTTKDTNCHDDAWFSNDVFEKKFDMFVDTSVKCKHLLNKKPKGLFNDQEKNFNPNLLNVK